MNSVALQMVDNLSRVSAPRVEVGVVRYYRAPVVTCCNGGKPGGAETLLKLTEYVDRARGAASSAGVDECLPQMNYAAGATEAVKALKEGRNVGAGEPEPVEVVFFFAMSAPCPDHDFDADLIQAGKTIERSGAELYVACPSTVDHVWCNGAKQAVRRNRYAQYPETSKLLNMLASALADNQNAIYVNSLSLKQTVPSGMSFVPDSADTPPTDVETIGGDTHLTWTWDRLNETQPFTVTYGVAPVSEGSYEVTGSAELVDSDRRTRTLYMPSAPITVTGSCAPDTPTPTPTDTASATPTATPTFSPTATPTTTPAPLPQPLYLPVAVREVCLPGQRHVDVVLVLDASTSMLQPTEFGGSKLDAARAAAAVFLDQLRLGDGDQASIVTFNADAELAPSLTTDRAALDAALANIEAAPQTCLVCAVEISADELASNRRNADNTPTLILLTDGQSNPRPASEAVERAESAKDEGIVVFTIGLGDELDFDALEAMASRPRYFYHTPRAEDVEAIYREIAVSIPCPSSDFWGNRR